MKKPKSAIEQALSVAKSVTNSPVGVAKDVAPVVGGEGKDEYSHPADANIETTDNPNRIKFKAQGPAGVKAIVVPRHMWTGSSRSIGMREINRYRAQVYGAENRDPLTLGEIEKAHKQAMQSHFAKPVAEQRAAEAAALERLRAARHISHKSDTLDESAKLDTINYEEDAQGRKFDAYGSKGVAGHALYTSGHGPNQKQVVLNTCPGQTTGCGGGVSADGVVDTIKGTCFAPNAESQYADSAIRRACHAQAKHDPKMTQDWILAHIGSLRNAAERADKKGRIVLFRPNIVDESDRSSREVVATLNKQRAEKGLPAIIGNSYGKTNELNDPENGWYVTYSNSGPKVKRGVRADENGREKKVFHSVRDNYQRDASRVRATITAMENRDKDLVNEQGNLTPPKNSYMVIDAKRDSDHAKNIEKAVKYAKYWSAPRKVQLLSTAEQNEGGEGHFDGNGNPTTPDKAHYGHVVRNGMRYDYQKQHILHPRLVQVGVNKDGTPHMVPTDSRFRDEEYLPRKRFKTKNGKVAGAILMTTPTTSTSNDAHESEFTHHVDDGHLEHARKNNGEYEIDAPHEQEKAANTPYAAPQTVKFRAYGGAVGHGVLDEAHDGMPSQSLAVQMHYAHRPETWEEAETNAARAPSNRAVQRALQITGGLGTVPAMMGSARRR
jgi:hypothetical protein